MSTAGIQHDVGPLRKGDKILFPVDSVMYVAKSIKGTHWCVVHKYFSVIEAGSVYHEFHV